MPPLPPGVLSFADLGSGRRRGLRVVKEEWRQDISDLSLKFFKIALYFRLQKKYISYRKLRM